jgi:hypothetical protein
MNPGVGCKVTHYRLKELQGEAFKRVPSGMGRKFDTPDRAVNLPSICHDCNAPVGQLHHEKCDMEECPECGMQMLCCSFDCRLDPRSWKKTFTMTGHLEGEEADQVVLQDMRRTLESQ